MNLQELTLDQPEGIIFALRRLYDRHGYCRYRMNKFEGYDLYARNRDFLRHEQVLTFTDADGRLMALKPDVTLSIVKNSRDSETLQKLYYNENVYRVGRDAQGFREIMQVGLECLGDIDLCCISEVLELAARSLDAITPDWILDISHLGLLSGLADSLGLPREKKDRMLALIAAKNSHELQALCAEVALSEAATAALCGLAMAKGAPEQVIPRLRAMLTGLTDTAALDELELLYRTLEATGLSDRVRLDLSVVDDVHYYNGIVFKGFIRGIPEPVLTGGQYDNLMRKMHRSAGAIGFAVYTDLLERLESAGPEYDVDTVLLYDDTTPLTEVRAAARALMAEGAGVQLQRSLPKDLRCRRVLKLQQGEVREP